MVRVLSVKHTWDSESEKIWKSEQKKYNYKPYGINGAIHQGQKVPFLVVNCTFNCCVSFYTQVPWNIKYFINFINCQQNSSPRISVPVKYSNFHALIFSCSSSAEGFFDEKKKSRRHMYGIRTGYCLVTVLVRFLLLLLLLFGNLRENYCS